VGRSITLLIASLIIAAAAQTVAAQTDPLELQKRGIARIDAVVDQFRRTGDTRLDVAELRQAEAELAASNQTLASRQAWSSLSLGLIKQGHVHRMMAQWQEAIRLYHTALDAAVRGRDVVRQSDALAWQALAESSSRNLGGAFADATRAVQLADIGGDADVLARALDVLGSVQVAQGDLAGAADTINREIALASRASDPTASYYAYLNRSDVYLKLAGQCDYRRTFEACNQSLDRAQADLQQASAIVQKLGYGGLVRQTGQFMKDVADRRALVQSQQSQFLTISRTAVFQPKRANDVLVTARFVAPPQPISPEFAELLQASRALAKQLGGFADTTEARSQFTEGVAAEMQGNNDAALGFYLKAVEALDRDRRSLRDERGRGTFAEDRIDFYYHAVLQLLDKGRFPDAFELLERSRSRALTDLIASRTPGLGRPAEQKLYADSALLRTQIADAQGRLFELAAQPDASRNAARLTALTTQIRSLEGQYQQVVSRMAVEAPRLQNLVDSKPATLSALQEAMRRERFEVIQYLVLEAGVIVWHIGADSATVRNVFLPRTQLTAKVASLQKSLADRQGMFDDTTAREMFLFLIQPVLAQIHSDRLVIIPHEDLNNVPFQVFHDPVDGRYLGERFDVSYAPSVSVLLGLKRSSPLTGGRLLGAADPSIVSAPGEVAAIARLFPGRGRTVTDVLMRESDVKAGIADADVVHLSVHGKFNASEPMLSYISLAPGGGDDGRLTAAEMFGLPLENSRIVVLSACETGRAEATHGNELLGLQRALLYAGAGTLVLSYWEVDSDATALWMRTFYEAALTRPIADAARAALVRVKSNPAYSHPYYWAAFGMIGR
jgi:CHAT domain-containing protein